MTAYRPTWLRDMENRAMAHPYELGRRNPATLPGRHRDGESSQLNRARTVYWRSLRRQVVAHRFIGSKY